MAETRQRLYLSKYAFTDSQQPNSVITESDPMNLTNNIRLLAKFDTLNATSVIVTKTEFLHSAVTNTEDYKGTEIYSSLSADFNSNVTFNTKPKSEIVDTKFMTIPMGWWESTFSRYFNANSRILSSGLIEFRADNENGYYSFKMSGIYSALRMYVTYDNAILKPKTLTIDQNLNITQPVKLSWILGDDGSIAGIPYNLTQKSCIIEWRVKGSSTVNTVEGTGNTYYTFPANTFASKSIIEVRVKATSDKDVVGVFSEWQEFSFFELPTVLSLEPNGIDQNADNAIKVTWVSKNQDRYALRVKQNNAVIKTYTGTTEQGILIPAKTLPHGTTTLELDVYNVATNYTATTTASFVAYGTPPTPQQDLKTTYNTSRPTFTWLLNSEQVAYQLQVLKGTTVLEDSTQLTGTANSYDCKTALENNQTLDVKVRIKNRYNLWSEWSIKTIKIYYAVLPTPSFTLSVDEDKVIVSCFSPVNDNFYSHEVYRSTGDNVWARMALNLSKEDTFTDHTCASDVTYYYKVSAIGVNGGITDSDIKSVKTTCNDFNFIDVENMDTRHTLRKEPKVSSRMIREVTGVKYSGTLAPTREASGEKPYKQFSMAFTFDREDEMMFEKLLMTEVLLLKDGRGNKLYGFIDGSIEESNQEAVNLKTVSFTFTQVNFLEADIYDPKHQRKVIYLDGTYMLDGTLLLNGLEGVVK